MHIIEEVRTTRSGEASLELRSSGVFNTKRRRDSDERKCRGNGDGVVKSGPEGNMVSGGAV